MSYSDEDWDRETSVEHQESDQKMKQYWAKKARRRSSLFKIPVGDNLGLKEHAKIGMLLTKNGELVSSCSTLAAAMRQLRALSKWVGQSGTVIGMAVQYKK